MLNNIRRENCHPAIGQTCVVDTIMMSPQQVLIVWVDRSGSTDTFYGIYHNGGNMEPLCEFDYDDILNASPEWEPESKALREAEGLVVTAMKYKDI